MVDEEKTPIRCQDCGTRDEIDLLKLYEWMEGHPCTSSKTMKEKRKGAIDEDLRFSS